MSLPDTRDGAPPIRVALFVSSLEGHRILADLIEDSASSGRLRIVGVATDDPHAPFSNPSKRLWGRLDAEETASRMRLIRDLCAEHALPCYDGRVHAPPRKAAAAEAAQAFARRLAEIWRPDVAYMCVFGQRIPSALSGAPRFGFFNVHPSRIERLEEWPRYGGPSPYRAMMQAGESHFNMVLHRIDEAFDQGEAVAFSAPIPLRVIPGRGFDPAVRRAVDAASSAVIRAHLAALIEAHPHGA